MPNLRHQLFRIIQVNKRPRHNIRRLHQPIILLAQRQHQHENPLPRNMNPVLHHRLMYRLIRIIIQLIPHRNPPVLPDRPLLRQLHHVPIVRHDDILPLHSDHVLCHLRIMLQHKELPVIRHIIPRFQPLHELHVILKIRVPRQMQRPQIRQMRLPVLNHTRPLTQQPIHRVHHVRFIPRNRVTGKHNHVTRLNLNKLMRPRHHPVQYCIQLPLRPRTHHRNLVVRQFHDLLHLHNRILRNLNHPRSQRHLNIINH